VTDKDGNKYTYFGVYVKKREESQCVLDIGSQLVHSRVVPEKSNDDGSLRLHVFNDEVCDVTTIERKGLTVVF
jgi:hypothetical protein